MDEISVSDVVIGPFPLMESLTDTYVVVVNQFWPFDSEDE